MAYVTNFTKTPLEMLLGLLNNDNNFSLVPADVAVRNLEVITQAPSGNDANTSIEIDLLTNEVQDDYAKFYYNRIDLTYLFSLIEPSVRQVDVPVDEYGMPVDNNVFITELLRKYGVAFNTNDFAVYSKYANSGLEADKGILLLVADASNVAYFGAVEIDVVASLAARLATTQLDGFTKDSLVVHAPG